MKRSTSGQVLISEKLQKNKAVLMVLGQVSISKTSNTVKQLANWFSGVDPKFRDDFELLELVQQAFKLFSKIPLGEIIQIGYQEDRELIGLEVMFSAFKCAFFTVTIRSSEAEYYEIDKNIERSVSSFHLKTYLFDIFKKQFKYRLSFIAKKLNIINPTKVLQHRPRLANFTNNFHLLKEIMKDYNMILKSPDNDYERDGAKLQEFEEKLGDFNSSKGVKFLELQRLLRPEADQEPQLNLDNSALNGRISVWSKNDLHRYFAKISQNERIQENYELDIKSKAKAKVKRQKEQQKNNESNMQLTGTSFNPTPALPFFVRKFSKPEQLRKTQLKSTHQSFFR